MTKISVKVPEILLPDASVDMSKWAVVACDQYTSEPDYWEGVKKATDGSPSTLNIIFPEVYLSKDNKPIIRKVKVEPKLPPHVAAMKEIERLTAKEKETAEALNTLKAKISDNDAVIEKLKKEIVVLTAENRELKQNAEVTLRKEKALASKINEIEKENKNLVTSLNLAREDAAKTELTLNKLKAERTQLKTRPSMPKPPQTAAQQSQAQKESVKMPSETGENTTPPLKTKTSVVNPNVLPSATERDMAYRDDSADAIAAFGEPVQELEEVEVEGNEMDLSMIFGDSDVSFKDENTDSMATATNPDIEQVKATTINQPVKAVANMQSGGPYEDMEVTDHSIKAHGGVSRKPVGRLPPTYRGSEAYSDFLKKTKSVFYRIKWSLFKE